MAQFLTSQEILDKYVTNQITKVEGEQSLYDKILSYIDSAEAWIIDNYISRNLNERIQRDISSYATIIKAAQEATAHLAMAKAIPFLDVVLTPNGYAVVSNNTLAPASRDRVDRLINMHRSQAHTALDELLSLLAPLYEWSASLQCSFFAASLFPFFANIETIQEAAQDNKLSGQLSWSKYKSIRARAIAAEQHLSDKFFSGELMQALRLEYLGVSKSNHSLIRLKVLTLIRIQVQQRAAGQPIHPRTITDILNTIRQNPIDFPEWHKSPTANLFKQKSFKNKKQSGGYFF